jgi:hypothetical protein
VVNTSLKAAAAFGVVNTSLRAAALGVVHTSLKAVAFGVADTGLWPAVAVGLVHVGTSYSRSPWAKQQQQKDFITVLKNLFTLPCFCCFFFGLTSENDTKTGLCFSLKYKHE